MFQSCPKTFTPVALHRRSGCAFDTDLRIAVADIIANQAQVSIPMVDVNTSVSGQASLKTLLKVLAADYQGGDLSLIVLICDDIYGARTKKIKLSEEQIRCNINNTLSEVLHCLGRYCQETRFRAYRPLVSTVAKLRVNWVRPEYRISAVCDGNDLYTESLPPSVGASCDRIVYPRYTGAVLEEGTCRNSILINDFCQNQGVTQLKLAQKHPRCENCRRIFTTLTFPYADYTETIVIPGTNPGLGQAILDLGHLLKFFNFSFSCSTDAYVIGQFSLISISGDYIYCGTVYVSASSWVSAAL